MMVNGFIYNNTKAHKMAIYFDLQKQVCAIKKIRRLKMN